MHVIKDFKERVKASRFKLIILFMMLTLLITVVFIRGNLGVASGDPTKVIVNDVIETMNLNANSQDKVIVIDPGHGIKWDMSLEPLSPGSNKKRVKAPVGAIGDHTKIPEYKVDWDVSLKLKKILEDKGFIVVMTKSDISENPGGIERAEIGNKANARLVVRIHADSFEDQSVSGTTILVPEAINDDKKALSEESSRCANIILNTLENEVGMKTRGVVLRNDLTAFNWSNVPTLLIEMGFLSNKNEDELLNTEDYQNKMAQAIADGVEESVKIEWNN
jgi:N-acetylmuramoyl-L-alanine amidase